MRQMNSTTKKQGLGLTQTERAKTMTLGEIEDAVVKHRDLLKEMGFLDRDTTTYSEVIGMVSLVKMLRKE